ncbi:hypothetical protein CRUP_012773, partial [Coryphaenoides rupestris]
MVVVVAAVFGDVLDNYAKTEGAWILSLRRRAYAIGSVQECATKCDTEENFVCNITPEAYPTADLQSNYCRNPDNDANGPCGEDYRGKISTTVNGYTCQHWASQKPHTHGYNPATLTENHLEVNYCRNPDGEPRPWCLTTSLSKRWDYCSIPHCSESTHT